MVGAKVTLGPAGSGGYSKSTLEGVQKIQSIGLQTLEVQFVHGLGMKNELAKEVGKAATDLGVPLSCHAPFFVNLASKEKAKIEASKKRILDSCERMHFMGGGPVVFHPAFFGGMDRRAVYDQAKESMLDMMEAIKENKWRSFLAPETTGKHSALGSLDEIIMMIKETGCSCCVDFAHLYARNNGFIDYGEVFDALKPVMKRLGGRIHSHFSGIEYSEKGERNHLGINSDSPPFKPLAEEILKRGLDITIICESPVTWRDSLVMKKVFEGLGYEFNGKDE